MAEKEGIDINDSKKSDLSSPEEIDLNGQIEIIPPDKDPAVEPLEALQDKVASEEAENESGQSDSEIFNEIKLPLNQDDGESELSTKDIEIENSSQTADEQKDGQADLKKFDDNDFLEVDDEEFHDEPPEELPPHPVNETVKSHESGNSEINFKKDNEPAENQIDSHDKNRNSAKFAEISKVKFIIGNWSLSQIIIGLTLLLMSFAGGVIYMNPAILELKKEAKPVSFKKIEPTHNLETAPKQVESFKSPGKSDIYLVKIRDAGLLRDELLVKKEEIYQLKRYYQNGINDLAAQIGRALSKTGITSYTEALKNRGIELNLRTIQRRRSYIQRLEEPIRWITQGSEELLYLKRKAEFDLQLVGIAGGIDMDRHMRHISAAIQKYRPSAQRLAVHRENADLPTLETIWGQIKDQKKKNSQAMLNIADKEITKEICSGNYERTAELSSMSAATARCLSKKTGSDLFLNQLTVLSPAAAKHLFQWRGSWICINGIKELSPAAAQHLFKWEGNWISLNGLTEFPPELATYLMEWEGNQLELMGLRYNKKNADQKTLKYLALWEAMGGKLFISDDVRKELERAMM